MAITKGERIIAGGTTGSAGYQIHHFNSKQEYLAARAKGALDESKYYSYPEIVDPKYETTMKIQYDDGSVKEYIIYCKEV